MDKQTTINVLATKIQEAKDTYYNGNPIMSDAAYDALEDQLRALDPKHPAILKVGAPVSSGWSKVTHAIPMSSLNKAQDNVDLKGWFTACTPTEVLVTDKLDGISLSLRYDDRKLTQALTRGDGTIGEDITRNVLLMQGAVKMLPATLPDGTPTPRTVYVRAEIVCFKSDFAVYFPNESNPRNTASGTAKRQSDPAKCAYLTVMSYQLLPSGQALATKEMEMKALKSMGFTVPRYKACRDATEVEALYQEYVSTIRASLDYDIDGLVIDVNDRNEREGLGDKNHRPRGSVAYKFPHEEQPSEMIDIEWQVGNSGRITPVAIFTPVVLGGREVKRASLATVRQVNLLKLYKGCKILVSLRNDCIPRVEANTSEGISNI